nr:inovirus-type Gp2 protein [uncultured Halomonas sp.]
MIHYDKEDAEWPEIEFHIDAVFDGWGQESDERLLAHVKEVEAVVERLLETDEVLFEICHKKDGKSRLRTTSLSGNKLKKLILNGCEYECKGNPIVNSHPYVEAFHTACEELGLETLEACDPDEQAVKLNTAVEMIRGVLHSKAMKRYLRKLDNAKRVRRKGAQKLISGLRDRYSRLEVLRLDLSYRKGKYVDLDNFSEALANVKIDWEMFRRDLVAGVSAPSVVGYLAKLEYGLRSGFHFHVVVLIDGSKHREDITLTKMLGEHWNNQVVSAGEGRYYNCNRHKNDYRYLGIGTLNHYDDAKYSALVNLVIEYMIKTDYVMAAKASGERTWFRSAHKPFEMAGLRGRPRKVISQDD